MEQTGAKAPHGLLFLTGAIHLGIFEVRGTIQHLVRRVGGSIPIKTKTPIHSWLTVVAVDAQ